MTDKMKIIRSGVEHVYELKDGEKWCVHNGQIIISHPDRKPFVLVKKGTWQRVNIEPNLDNAAAIHQT